MFLTLIIAASTLLHLYLYWRLKSIPLIERRISVKWLRRGFSAFWLITIIGHPVSHYEWGTVAFGMDWLGMHWIGSLFIFFSVLLLTDLATGFGYLLPQQTPRIRVVALFIGLGMVLLANIQGRRAPVVESFEVQIPNLPRQADGTVVAVLSDLHIGTMLDEAWLSERIEQVNALEADMVFLVGDLVEGHGVGEGTDELLATFRNLKAQHGVYVVPGNHEGYGENPASLHLFSDAGFTVLRDRWSVPTQGIVVAGIDDATVRSAKERGQSPFKTILTGKPEGAATILLSHRPDLVQDAADAGVDLMFSGHTHGGQIWPFNFIVQFVFPFVEGQYSLGKLKLFVCRGTGTWGPRMRLWEPNQILRIAIKSSDS